MQCNDDKRPIEAATPRLSPGETRQGSRYFVLLAIAGFFLARIPVLPHRLFDPDELEHAHAAWCVFKGMIPYKDFW
ncbi:MAG TPA: hypothetical protein VF524_08615 [Polyangia bacterium]